MKETLIKIAAVALAAAIVVSCILYTTLDVLEVVRFNFGQKLVFLLVSVLSIGIPTGICIYILGKE
jgi:hypothetical protein